MASSLFSDICRRIAQHVTMRRLLAVMLMTAVASGCDGWGTPTAVEPSQTTGTTAQAPQGRDTTSIPARLRSLPVNPFDGPLVIASFRVVEYAMPCRADCPYLLYAPLVELQAASGADSARVLGVSIDVGERTTWWCSGNVPYRSGERSHLIGFEPYPSIGDLMFQAPKARPISGLARVSLLVSAGDGTRSLLTATTTVQSTTPPPALPDPSEAPVWTCAH
ncbi:hypothetical protein [Gemmatimonas aurantiaca]|uniref:hypothetical protein n=1 Tax=Gemmatimonas aurantiaca TaxID=173480 RepID=UPI00301C97CC